MNLLIYFVSFFISVELFSQNNYHCYITFSFKDCVNCNQPFRTFSKIPTQLNPKVVFRMEDKKIAIKYMETQLKVNPKEEQIVFSDSLYGVLSDGDMVQSQVHLLWRNKVLVKSSLLKNFLLHQLEPFLAPIEVKARFPDSLTLASADFRISPNYLFLKDHLFQKIYIYDKQVKKIIHTITSKSISPINLYRSYYGDTTGYYDKIGRFKKQLESIDRFEPSFNSILLSEQGKFIVEWVFSYAIPEKRGIGIYGQGVISQWVKNNEFIGYKELEAKNGYKIQTITSIDEKSAIAKVYHEKDSITANTYFLAQYEVNNKTKEIIQKKLCLKFPEFAIKSKTEYMYLSGRFCYPYYFFGRENLVGNIETGEYFHLLDQKIENNYEEIMKTSSSRYTLRDVVRIKNDTYRVLYELDKDFFIADFNLSQQKLLSQKNIAIPKGKKEKNLISGLNFDSSGTKIHVFTSDNELLEISF